MYIYKKKKLINTSIQTRNKDWTIVHHSQPPNGQRLRGSPEANPSWTQTTRQRRSDRSMMQNKKKGCNGPRCRNEKKSRKYKAFLLRNMHRLWRSFAPKHKKSCDNLAAIISKNYFLIFCNATMLLAKFLWEQHTSKVNEVFPSRKKSISLIVKAEKRKN